MQVVTSFYIVNVLGLCPHYCEIKCHEIQLICVTYAVNFQLIFSHKIIKLSITYFFPDNTADLINLEHFKIPPLFSFLLK